MHDTNHRTARGIIIPAQAITWQFDRASGPGGQHVNKTSSKATLQIDIASLDFSGLGAGDAVRARLVAAFGATLTITESTSRSQWRNRQMCLQRASDELDRASAPPAAPRRPTRPTRASDTRRLTAKRHRGQRLRDRSRHDD